MPSSELLARAQAAGARVIRLHQVPEGWCATPNRLELLQALRAWGFAPEVRGQRGEKWSLESGDSLCLEVSYQAQSAETFDGECWQDARSIPLGLRP